MKCVIGVVVWVAYFWGTAAEVRGEDGMFTEEVRVSGNRAVLLSALCPGLGQMASGQKLKGGVFLLAELVAVMAAVDGHESYKTRLGAYETSMEEYAALRKGGTYREAEAKWRHLLDMKDDLDSLHRRRQIFGYAAAGIYVLNVIDIVWSRSRDATANREVDGRPAVSLGFGGGGTVGIVVSKDF